MAYAGAVTPPSTSGQLDLEGLVHLLDHTEELMQSISPTGRVLWVNRAWREALGFAADEVEDLTVQDFVAPESLPHCMEVMGRIIQGEAVSRIEAVFLTRDGAQVRVEGSAQARHVDGECVATFGVFRRVGSERQRDHDLRHFFDLSLDLFLIASLDGYIRYLNPAWKTYLGYELDELAGRLFLDLVHEDDLEGTISALGKLAEGEAVIGFENRYRHREGSYRRFLWTAAPDPNPESDHVYAAARDVTDLRAAQAEVEEREDQQRALIEATVDGILGVDSRGRIASANPAAARILGCEEADLRGGDLRELLVEPHRSELGEALAAYRRQGDAGLLGSTRILEGVRADGARVPVEWTLSEVPGARERPLMVTFRDISERLALERLKSQFLSTVSHELRTPLTSIRGSLRLLEEGVVGKLPAEAQDIARVAHSNCLRLGNLIDDILDLEKLEAGHMTLEFEKVDMAHLVVAAVDRLVGFAAEYGVELLAPEVAPMDLVCDPERVEQVLANLLSNAVKFSPAGGKVSVRIVDVPDRVRVEIDDQGPGVPAEERERIFQRFQQGDSTDRRQRGGTGLGLAIGRALVEAHGGSVGVEPREVGGSRFWIELPRRGA